MIQDGKTRIRGLTFLFFCAIMDVLRNKERVFGRKDDPVFSFSIAFPYKTRSLEAGKNKH